MDVVYEGERSERRDEKLAEDEAMLDWLNEQIVNVIDLDDGRIIDVRGNDVREAIRKAMADPTFKPRDET